jgi:hypothetical protein
VLTIGNGKKIKIDFRSNRLGIYASWFVTAPFTYMIFLCKSDMMITSVILSYSVVSTPYFAKLVEELEGESILFVVKRCSGFTIIVSTREIFLDLLLIGFI